MLNSDVSVKNNSSSEDMDQMLNHAIIDMILIDMVTASDTIPINPKTEGSGDSARLDYM